jgi:hypothetical protein
MILPASGDTFKSAELKFATNTQLHMYTQSGLISNTVNVSVLVVRIFSQNFRTNGAYVVLNVCKFADPYFLNFLNKAGPYFLKNF